MNVTNLYDCIPEINEKHGLRLRHPHIEGLHRVRNLLMHDLREHHPIPKLARVAQINDYDLKRMFKAVFGKNMYEFLMHERIEYAKQKLMLTNKKIADIAEECGYRNPEYFTIFFKKETGMTPTEYRKLYSMDS